MRLSIVLFVFSFVKLCVLKEKGKSSFMTIFKKLDPPKCAGDHLGYLEWKDNGKP